MSNSIHASHISQTTAMQAQQQSTAKTEAASTEASQKAAATPAAVVSFSAKATELAASASHDVDHDGDSA